MLKFIIKKSLYGLLVLVGVVVLVFFLFQGFGDPSRLVMGQSGDSATQANIKKELYLDQPKWKQFVYYLNDVSPICFHSKTEIEKKNLKGFFVGYFNNAFIDRNNFIFKFIKFDQRTKKRRRKTSTSIFHFVSNRFFGFRIPSFPLPDCKSCLDITGHFISIRTQSICRNLSKKALRGRHCRYFR